MDTPNSKQSFIAAIGMALITGCVGLIFAYIHNYVGIKPDGESILKPNVAEKVTSIDGKLAAIPSPDMPGEERRSREQDVTRIPQPLPGIVYKHNSLKFNGIYMFSDINSPAAFPWQFFRFFPDGRVVSCDISQVFLERESQGVKATIESEHVMKMYQKKLLDTTLPEYAVGTYSIQGRNIAIAVKNSKDSYQFNMNIDATTIIRYYPNGKMPSPISFQHYNIMPERFGKFVTFDKGSSPILDFPDGYPRL